MRQRRAPRLGAVGETIVHSGSSYNVPTLWLFQGLALDRLSSQMQLRVRPAIGPGVLDCPLGVFRGYSDWFAADHHDVHRMSDMSADLSPATRDIVGLTPDQMANTDRAASTVLRKLKVLSYG